MNGRQQCPSCERHWTPPGPCSNFDPQTGEVCAFVERERPADRPATRLPTAERPQVPRDGAHTVGIPVDPKDHLAEARAELARITEERKHRGLPVGGKVA